jgi:CheY-like chemotaxis protein
VVNDQPRRILLVEDDRFLRKAAETTLKQQGYTVITAADGEEALRVARSAPPDLILLDVIMPKLNGFQVLDALKKDPTTAHIPVIILSNLGQDRDVQQAMEAGATAYFIKADLSLQALVQRVGETLAAGGA